MKKWIIVITVIALASMFAFAQSGEIKKGVAPYSQPSSGSQMFKDYCASCHGANAKGKGPVATSLKTPPADLTRLTAKNGVFPEMEVYNSIMGDQNAANGNAHGVQGMPVWGPVFSQLGGQHGGEVNLRVRNLTKYIETLQQK